MTPQQKRKLEKLSKNLHEAQTLLQELLQESKPEVDQEATPDFEARKYLASLKASDRISAEKQLSGMKQNELGSIFVEADGPASDRRKPKAWLLEQILWRLFDFERGHDAIRSSTGDGKK